MIKIAIFCSLAALVLGPRQEAEQYAVIVNAKNTCSQTGDALKSTIKKLFLKELTKWPDGTEAKPYSRKDDADETAAFLKSVLDMSQAELARHWLKMKNTNGITPPNEVSSERMVLKYVAKHDGAFGIVKLSVAEGESDVKILYKF